MRLGNKTYFVEMEGEAFTIHQDDLPEHLRFMPDEDVIAGTCWSFKIQADRAYIAEYGMRFYRQGTVFLIIPHQAYKQVRLIECDELKEKMEAGDES